MVSPSWRRLENAVRKYPGIDVRGDRGYIVVPPSIHESGRRYRWLNNLNLSSLSCFPQELFSIVNADYGPIVKEKGWKTHERLDIAKSLEEMRDGNIDNTLVSILGRMRHDGWSADDAQTLL